MKKTIALFLALILIFCPLFSVYAETPEWKEKGWLFCWATMKGPDEETMPFDSCTYRVPYTGKQITPEVTVYAVFEDSDGKYHEVKADEKDYTYTWEEGRTEVGCYDYKLHYEDAYGNVSDRTAFFSIMPNPPVKIDYGFDWPNVVFTWPETPGTTSFVFMQYNEETGRYDWLQPEHPDGDRAPYTKDRYHIVTGLEKGKTYYFAVRPGPHMLFEPAIIEMEVTIPLDEKDMKPAPLLPHQTTTRPTTTTTSVMTTTTTKNESTTLSSSAVTSTNSTPTSTSSTTAPTSTSAETQPSIADSDVSRSDLRYGWLVFGILGGAAVLGALLIGGAWLIRRKKTI